MDKNTKEEFIKKQGGFKAEPLETLIQEKWAENLDPARKTEKMLSDRGRKRIRAWGLRDAREVSDLYCVRQDLPSHVELFRSTVCAVHYVSCGAQ